MTNESPTRPLTREACLQQAAPAPNELATHGVEGIAKHIEEIAWWPESARGEIWDIGDFSFYILQFEIEGELRYVQLWSEPGENLLIEVSSGAWGPSRQPTLPPAAVTALLNRGFEVGGKARNHCKQLPPLQSAEDSQRVAREMLGLITECLGYDGQASLDYKLSLGRRTRTAQVFDRLSFDDLGRLLRSWDVIATPIEAAKRNAYRCTTESRFVASLQIEREDAPGEYGVLTFVAHWSDHADLLASADAELRRALPFARNYIDDEGDLTLIFGVTLYGGVTAEHLRRTLELWLLGMKQVRETIAKHRARLGPRVLN